MPKPPSRLAKAPRLWLVEPHVDDVFLSLHTHITGRWAAYPKTIVSVFSTPRREEEGRAYAMAVGCDYLALGLAESGGLGKEPGKVPPFSEWRLECRPGDVLVFPLGLQHPDHLAVVGRIPEDRYVLRYLDTPYYAKQKLGEEMQEKASGLEVFSLAYSGARKWAHIPTFKTQAKFFHFNPPESLPRLELVLCRLDPISTASTPPSPFRWS